MDIIRARARYCGHTEGYFTNNTFYNIKIRQDGTKVIMIVEGDVEKKSKMEYENLKQFFNKWDICCAYQ